MRQELELIFGLSAAVIIDSLQVKYFSNNHSIIRVARDDVQSLLACLVFITTLGKAKVRFDILHVSGTIKKLEEFIIEHDTRQLMALKSNINGPNPLALARDEDDD